MNLKQFRLNNLEKIMMDYLIEHKPNGYIDQDALNYVSINKIKYMPLKFNIMVGAGYHPSYEQEEFDKAVKDPVVVHFVRKPWCSGPIYFEYKKDWEKYREIVNNIAPSNVNNILV